MKPTQEQIIAWAREADMNYLQHLSEESMKQVKHYTALVYEAGCKDENEACAEVFDDMANDMAREMEPSPAIAYVRNKAAEIRARMKP